MTRDGMRIQPATRRIGVLLSGRGSNFCAIADRIDSGALDAEIGLVLGNRADAAGLGEARRRGLETLCLPSKGQSREVYTRSVLEALAGRGISLVCLAGFMRVLGADFVRAFPWGILNIHPSLLPAFPGLDVQRQALEHGVRFSGCTVHFVDESLDGGPILAQAVVPVLGEDTADTLAGRILGEEHRIYSEAIASVLDGRCEIRGRRVIVHEG
jgi:phosphoribosylglycinamide formyltransferase-1